MEQDELWDEALSIINRSDKEVYVFGGERNIGIKETENLGLDKESFLGAIILYTSGICIDNWVRIIGQNSVDRRGIVLYNNDSSVQKELTEGMLIVGQDIVGGIFAINNGKFREGIHQIWYFAPDTLEWECLDLDYFELFTWLLSENIDKFYSSMRWDNWREDCKLVRFDEVILIYPFLWSKECNLKSISKKIVPFEELRNLNFDLADKINKKK